MLLLGSVTDSADPTARRGMNIYTISAKAAQKYSAENSL
jgi:hypothetical protein